MAKGRFGGVRQLRSGRWQARYIHQGREHKGPTTFLTSGDAHDWLAQQQVNINEGIWQSPGQAAAKKRAAGKKITFKDYAEQWLIKRRTRRGELSAKTRAENRRIISRYLLALHNIPVAAITREDIEDWYAGQNHSHRTQVARSYSLLSTILKSATEEGLLPANPCVIPGASYVESPAHEIEVIDPKTLDELVGTLPERLRVLPLLAFWCALRFGELTELRRSDIDLAGEVIRIRRAVIWTAETGYVVKAPKTRAGLRDVPIPPHLIEDLRTHLDAAVEKDAKALLFPAPQGGHLGQATWRHYWNKARVAVGHPTLRLHDLRHSGLTALAHVGATTKELMDVAGHSSPAAALRYQHSVDPRKRELAQRMSKLRDM
ncbi:tyrosine-type recombinase/integrase [Mycolicibacter algericus]|uniref:Integrase n=2 Tax=Mycolicibacter algericus TaxID=1288388 RepID=A0ABX3RY69_MYCAL|nr:site-specific integrase [Mycolicibacter algericus]OQZ98692.1 hypothetical protein BST10_03565 [Mycolicibacter algericus DSM 45454]GFG87746.1 putative prophage phiRv2 integrase [Mycolicibacter algericus]